MVAGLVLASALAFAVPANSPATWTSDRDYPSGALRRKEEGVVGFRLLIGPTGRVEECEITESSGSSDLDKGTCEIIAIHSKFKPAIDEAGQRSYNVFDGRLTWVLPGRSGPFRIKKPIPPQPNMELTVQKLPDGTREKTVRLIARFDTAGQMVACEPSPNNPEEIKLAKVACEQAKAMPAEITKDKVGNPIPLVKGLSILFKVAE